MTVDSGADNDVEASVDRAPLGQPGERAWCERGPDKVL
jgi:hypothetical protein